MMKRHVFTYDISSAGLDAVMTWCQQNITEYNVRYVHHPITNMLCLRWAVSNDNERTLFALRWK